MKAATKIKGSQFILILKKEKQESQCYQHGLINIIL